MPLYMCVHVNMLQKKGFWSRENHYE